MVEIIEVTDDAVKFGCTGCGKEQEIVSDHDHIQEMANDISAGVNPFTDGWEDGVGNTVHCNCK